MEDLDGSLEELHHSIEIKDDETSSLVDQVCEAEVLEEVKCGVCNVIFSDEVRLASHIIVHTLTKDLLRKFHPRTFSVIETSNQNIVFSCKICKYNTYEQGSFELHLRNHSDSTTLKYYKVIHSSGKLPTPKICKFQSPERSILRDYLQNVSKKCLVCEICDSRFVCEQGLKNHLKIHAPDKVYTCRTCGCTYGNRKDLAAHSKANHLPKEAETGFGADKVYTCGICGCKYGRRKDLKAHSKDHPRKKAETGFTCEYCGRTFRCRENLMKHLSTHNRNKTFECQYCSFKTSSSQYLAAHVKIHIGDKKFVCEFCGYKCLFKLTLKIHLRIHTGEKPFKCLICDYGTGQKTNLARHLKSHTGEKPFECEICGSSFATKQRFNYHLKSHTGEKPYMCEICGYKCVSWDTLTKHLKIHSGEKPFSCDLCDFKSVRNYAVKVHRQTHLKKK